MASIGQSHVSERASDDTEDYTELRDKMFFEKKFRGRKIKIFHIESSDFLHMINMP